MLALTVRSMLMWREVTDDTHTGEEENADGSSQRCDGHGSLDQLRQDVMWKARLTTRAIVAALGITSKRRIMSAMGLQIAIPVDAAFWVAMTVTGFMIHLTMKFGNGL